MPRTEFKSYREAHERARALYGKPHQWHRAALINIAHSGQFSSDRGT